MIKTSKYNIPDHILLFCVALIFFCHWAAGDLHAQPTPDKVYLIVSEQSGKVLQVKDAGEDNLANVELFRPHGGANQGWLFRRISPGNDLPVYFISSLRSDRVLDVMGYSKKNGANVQQFKYYGSRNQRWELVPAKDGCYEIISVNSGKCLEAEGAGQADGANIQQFECNGGAHQLWRLRENPHADRVYAIISLKSGKALDVAGKSRADDANVQQYTPNGGDNQLWTLWPTGHHNGLQTYAIISVLSGKSLDVARKSRASRANVQQFEYHGGPNQQWLLMPKAEDIYQIVSVNSGKCLDVAGQSEADGANVQQFECNGGSNQLWQLTEKPFRTIP